MEDLAIARWMNDAEVLSRLLSDAIELVVIGSAPITGKDAVIASIGQSQVGEIVELVVVHVSQHGWVGAVNGQLKLRGGSTIDFCDVCKFTNTKGTSVTSITSYVIHSA
ncbi:MAG: hypothetical protein ACRCZF_14520 [Gemmataceae bacterium]